MTHSTIDSQTAKRIANSVSAACVRDYANTLDKFLWCDQLVAAHDYPTTERNVNRVEDAMDGRVIREGLAAMPTAAEPSSPMVDLSPSWSVAVSIYIAALEDGTAEGKAMARKELMALGKNMDAAVKRIKELEGKNQ